MTAEILELCWCLMWSVKIVSVGLWLEKWL